MKRALLIAEKTSLQNTIAEVYKKHKNEFDFTIDFVAQSGHLLTLLLPSEIDEEQKTWKWDNLPFHPRQYNGWKYKVIPQSASKFENIKNAILDGDYDFIIHAGDPDREGELLVNLVLNYIGTKLPVYRFWTNALAESNVLNALHNMENDRTEPRLVNLYQSALARQHIDYLIGMNLTEAASLKMYSTVPVGRCKTVICSIICKREKEILNFTPHTDYELECTYDEQFKGVLFEENKEKTEDGTTSNIRFPDKKTLGDFTTQLGDTAKVISVKKEKTKQYAPKLYKLSSLQTEASAKYGYNAANTLEIVQSLYEKKFVSYPRTSCDVLSTSMDYEVMLQSIAEIPELESYVKTITSADIERIKHTKMYVDDKKMQEHGHYALSPTEIAPDLSALTTPEKNVLIMIFKRFLSIFLPPVIQEKTTIITENNGHKFRTNGKILLDAGYTKILDKKFEDNLLPDIKEGETVHVKGYAAIEKTTTCPKRYTDGELVRLLEKPAKFLNDNSLTKLGEHLRIGTDATRGEILKQLYERDKFIEYKKGNGKAEYIYPTERCMQVIENLGDREICRVDLSGQLELKLEEIQRGELDATQFEFEMEKIVESMVNDIQSADIKPLGRAKNVVCKCPKCNGDIIAGKKGYFCSNYKEGCQGKLFGELCGAKITPTDIEKLLSGKTIEKTLEKKDKSAKWKQKIKLNMEDMSYSFVKQQYETKEMNITCPSCSKAHLVSSGSLAKCPDCGFSIFINVGGKLLPEDTIQELLKNGQTKNKIEGFKAKSGKLFSAYLEYDAENKRFNYKFN